MSYTLTGDGQIKKTGPYTVNFTFTGDTDVTFPTSGTLSTGGGGGISTLDGDFGSATGATVSISGGLTGLTTSASGTNLSLVGLLSPSYGGTGVANSSASTITVDATSGTYIFDRGGSSNNLFLGNLAGNAAVSGNNNVSLGAYTFQNYVSGSDNIGIGFGALYKIGASKNIAIGTQALGGGNGTVTGINNIAIGFQTLYGMVGGNSNIVFGVSSLTSLSGSGNYNIVIGDTSMPFLDGGSSNISIGHYGMLGLGGSASNVGNVGLGDNTTASISNSLFNTSYCSFIGFGATASTDGLTNATAIGSNAVVSISNSVILGNACNVGIGTSTPIASLHVAGGQAVKITPTAVSYVVAVTDYIIAVTSTAAPRAITLPDATTNNGQVFIIKDESGGANTNNITVTAAVGNINGAANYVINLAYGSVSVYSNGANYFVF